MLSKYAALFLEKEASVFRGLKDILTAQQFRKGLRAFNTRQEHVARAEEKIRNMRSKGRWTNDFFHEQLNKGRDFVEKNFPSGKRDMLLGGAKTGGAYAAGLLGLKKLTNVDPHDIQNYQHIQPTQ